MMVIIDDGNGDNDGDDAEDDADDDDDDDDDGDTLVSKTHHNILCTGFKGSVRPDWRCRGCVVMIIIMTAGDAEDAR